MPRGRRGAHAALRVPPLVPPPAAGRAPAVPGAARGPGPAVLRAHRLGRNPGPAPAQPAQAAAAGWTGRADCGVFRHVVVYGRAPGDPRQGGRPRGRPLRLRTGSITTSIPPSTPRPLNPFPASIPPPIHLSSPPFLAPLHPSPPPSLALPPSLLSASAASAAAGGSGGSAGPLHRALAGVFTRRGMRALRPKGRIRAGPERPRVRQGRECEANYESIPYLPQCPTHPSFGRDGSARWRPSRARPT